ncbi:hypothetical protein Bbelb_387090 [Branchiostoma belcheri]|nr:hypothetical protein Bbelb_387090 [Branchiostoma belcheri]
MEERSRQGQFRAHYHCLACPFITGCYVLKVLETADELTGNKAAFGLEIVPGIWTRHMWSISSSPGTRGSGCLGNSASQVHCPCRNQDFVMRKTAWYTSPVTFQISSSDRKTAAIHYLPQTPPKDAQHIRERVWEGQTHSTTSGLAPCCSALHNCVSPKGYEMEMGTALRSGKSTGDLLLLLYRAVDDGIQSVVFGSGFTSVRGATRVVQPSLKPKRPRWVGYDLAADTRTWCFHSGSLAQIGPLAPHASPPTYFVSTGTYLRPGHTPAPPGLEPRTSAPSLLRRTAVGESNPGVEVVRP